MRLRLIRAFSIIAHCVTSPSLSGRATEYPGMHTSTGTRQSLANVSAPHTGWLTLEAARSCDARCRDAGATTSPAPPRCFRPRGAGRIESSAAAPSLRSPTEPASASRAAAGLSVHSSSPDLPVLSQRQNDSATQWLPDFRHRETQQ